MVGDTRGRRLWWRHLISILVFPVTMTLVIPALIAGVARARKGRSRRASGSPPR